MLTVQRMQNNGQDHKSFLHGFCLNHVEYVESIDNITEEVWNNPLGNRME
jgi:hypothetical protein